MVRPLRRDRLGRVSGLPDWLTNPDAYLGDFINTLSAAASATPSRRRPKRSCSLAGTGDRCALITHSWGTVVAYDALLDPAAEIPNLLPICRPLHARQPLWLVRRLLQDSSGRKPPQTAIWINIHAEGDPVGLTSAPPSPSTTTISSPPSAPTPTAATSSPATPSSSTTSSPPS
ncbi:MAG: hypothetical protein U0232_05785 [Thermomicrobiales bacterium]